MYTSTCMYRASGLELAPYLLPYSYEKTSRSSYMLYVYMYSYVHVHACTSSYM